MYAGPKSTSNVGNGVLADVWAETIVEAYAVDKIARIGPELNRLALKKYGDTLYRFEPKIFTCYPHTHRPDLSVNEPNLRAPISIECWMRSD